MIRNISGIVSQTQLEDLSPVEPELNAEELQLVAGAMPKADPDRTQKYIAFEGWCGDVL